MAVDEKPAKKTFPVVPTAHWWALRRKFQQSIPGVVTANYVASVLNMKEDSARANVLTGLKLTGIIDKDGKPTELARRWRDDAQYADVCAAIRDKCYPEELRAAFADPANEREGVARWFANHTGGGAGIVDKVVKFFILLSEADAAKGKEAPAKVPPRPKVAKTLATPRADIRHATPQPPVTAITPPPVAAAAATAKPDKTGVEGPSVHINLQVHISADASTDQIEQVFASMSKHIYRKTAE